MQVEPLSKALGAELVDFDITQARSFEERVELRRLFCTYHLLLVRGPELSPEDHDRFVGFFGPLQAHRAGDGAGYVTNKDHPQRLFPRLQPLLWHNDGAYGPRPGIGTSLWAIEVSPDAAPTMFANVVEVVDRFPTDLCQKAEALRIQNVRDTEFDRTYERVPLEEIVNSDDPDRYVTYEHPVLFQPPHLEHKAVIASQHMTSSVVGLPLSVGDAFLGELYGQMYAEDNVYAHHWQNNDVIMWDNIALHHSRPQEIGQVDRHLRRQCIDGWYTEDGDVVDWTFTRVKVRATQHM
jgi:taurine dioxygenase